MRLQNKCNSVYVISVLATWRVKKRSIINFAVLFGCELYYFLRKIDFVGFDVGDEFGDEFRRGICTIHYFSTFRCLLCDIFPDLGC